MRAHAPTYPDLIIFPYIMADDMDDMIMIMCKWAAKN